MSLGPRWLKLPAGEHAVAKFEREHSTRLPRDYRWFLTRLGDGGAGPGQGLMSLENVAKWVEGPLSGRFDPVDVENPVCGAIVMCEWGCGEFWLLCLTGKYRGTVWFDRGFDRLCESRDGRPLRFVEWYEKWLDCELTPPHTG